MIGNDRRGLASMNILARYITPPKFNDPEKTRRAFWLNRYLLAFGALTAVYQLRWI